MTVPLRIVIADGHALFRQGLASLLRVQEGVSVVAEVERASDLASTLEGTPCDVLLLDLQIERSCLPDIEMLAAHVAVVVVTATERMEDALAALRAGARGVVFKRYAIETLMDAIRAAVAGEVWMPPMLQGQLVHQLRVPMNHRLSRREHEIVLHVAQGLRNAEVAERLFISEATVKTHLNKIFHKLSLRDRVGLTLYAMRMGIGHSFEASRAGSRVNGVSRLRVNGRRAGQTTS